MNNNPTTGNYGVYPGVLSESNPTTGEWTVNRIDEWIRLNPATWRSVIVFEHRAGLAAERERVTKIMATDASRKEKLLREQLDEEREKVKQEWHERVTKLDLQLAAERASRNALELANEGKRQAFNELYEGIIDIMPQEFRQNNKGALHSVRKALAALAAERERAEASEYNFGVQVDETKRLTAELERERMCHAACGVIAMSNTPESLAKNSDMKPEYLSASVQDCIRAIERELQLRGQLAAAVEALKKIKAYPSMTYSEICEIIDSALAKIGAK